jgi:hypothetical protein
MASVSHNTTESDLMSEIRQFVTSLETSAPKELFVDGMLLEFKYIVYL